MESLTARIVKLIFRTIYIPYAAGNILISFIYIKEVKIDFNLLVYI